MKQLLLLKEKISKLPKKPGVYLFRDSNGKIIYIGKALSLKHRVACYFQKNQKDQKTQELIENIADIQTNLVDSEFEALLLEAQLIKKYQPKFNVNLKDDKSYLYIAISKEKPERIFLCRKSELKTNVSEWYGPFTTASDARQILKILRRIFPFRSCKSLPKSPCLYHHLKLCPAPCFLPNENYSETVSKLKQIFYGKTGSIIQILEKQMRESAQDLKYEQAQIYKKQIESLQALAFGWQNVPKERRETAKVLLELRKLLVRHQGNDPTTLHKIEGYDVSNLGKDIIVGSLAAFTDGEPDKSQYRKFNLKLNLSGPDDPEGIKQILKRRLNHPEWIYPQLALIDGGKTQVGAAFSALKEKNLENQIALLGLTKEEETIIIPRIAKQKIFSWQALRLSRSSLILQLLQAIRDESHRFAQKYYKVLSSKKIS